MTNDRQVESTVWLPVSPDEAFLLVTEPRRLRRWLMVAGTLDVSVGGDVHLVVAPGAHAVGRVTAVEPGRRFAYTHGWLGDSTLPPGTSSVEVILDPERDGTRVTVRHSGLPAGYEDMADGWNDFLSRLAVAAVGVHNPPDWPADGETATDAAVMESALYALLGALRRLDDVPDGQPTTSTDFTVGELAEHLVQNAEWLAQAFCADPTQAEPDAGREEAVADALWPIVRYLEGLAPDHVLNLGQDVTVQTVTQYLSVEFLVHAWDLAQAAGLELDASPALVGAVLKNCYATRDSLFFSSDAYGPAHASDTDEPLSRLLAATGR